jgi:hypothetical protein
MLHALNNLFAVLSSKSPTVVADILRTEAVTVTWYVFLLTSALAALVFGLLYLMRVRRQSGRLDSTPGTECEIDTPEMDLAMPPKTRWLVAEAGIALVSYVVFIVAFYPVWPLVLGR